MRKTDNKLHGGYECLIFTRMMLKNYIGYEYVIDETDDVVYIGSDFPDEYANSKYSTKALGTIGKAKANASQVIPELINLISIN